jgi:tetratricopeptide (TPR) repeat protein
MAGVIGVAAALVAAGIVLSPGPSKADDVEAGYRATVRGDHTAAIELLTRAIESGHLSTAALASAHINRGVAQRQRGQFQNAIDDYTRALELQRDNVLAFANRGLAFAKWERYEQAIIDFDRAIALAPSDPRLFLIRGNANFDQGAFEDAIKDYDEALQIQPQFREAAINRRHAYERLKHPDRTCRCSENAKPSATAPSRARQAP